MTEEAGYRPRRVGPVSAAVTVVVILALPYLIPKAWSLFHPADTQAAASVETSPDETP